MTDEIMSLRALLEKSSDADLLREMISFTAQRLMELEVEGLTGAAHGERSPDRINQRNGYRVFKACLHLGINEARIDLLAECVDDLCGCVFGHAKAVPLTRLVAREGELKSLRSIISQREGHERLVAQPPCSVDGTARFWGYVLNRGSNLCSRSDPRGGRPRALVQSSVARSPATARYHFRPFRCVYGVAGLD